MDLTGDVDSFKVRASSVLNKSSDFQARNMFVDDDSCWNSDGGSGENRGQWLFFDFLGKVVQLHSVSIMFQGGFVGQEGTINFLDNKVGEPRRTVVMDEIKRIEDSNDLQTWEIPPGPEAGASEAKFIKINFPTSTDFYGRVTIYKMCLIGNVV